MSTRKAPPAPEPRPPPRDLSGHITMNTEQSDFWKECVKNGIIFEAKRRQGLLKTKAERNPLHCDRSPLQRRKKGNFDYRPPPSKKQEPKWNYPEHDYGILSKLDSQKQIFEEMHRMEKEYSDLVEKKKKHFDQHERQKANGPTGHSQHNTFWENYADPDKERHLAETKIAETNYLRVKPITQSLDQLIKDYESEAGVKRTKMLTKTKAGESKPNGEAGTKKYQTFYEQPISTFKVLGQSSPKMLADWRAKRAADFVDKQPDPLGYTFNSEGYESTWQTRPHPAFRPAGINKELSRRRDKQAATGAGGFGSGSTFGVAGASTVGSSYGLTKEFGSNRSLVAAVPMENRELNKIDSWLANSNMDSLRKELTSTENAIEKQKVKMGLSEQNSQRPHYVNKSAVISVRG